MQSFVEYLACKVYFHLNLELLGENNELKDHYLIVFKNPFIEFRTEEVYTYATTNQQSSINNSTIRKAAQ